MANKILPYKKGTRNATVLVADGSSSRLFHVLHAANNAGFSVLLADSAASCISLGSQHKPDAVLLDEALLEVDQWSVPEMLNLVSPKSVIVLAAEELTKWQQLPKFVSRVVPHSDPAAFVSVLPEILR